MIWKQEALSLLQNKLIPFWESFRDDRFGGFSGFRDFSPNPDRLGPKGSILNDRVLWFFSRAAQATDNPALLSQARHAYAFLDAFWDREEGGVYWSCTCDGQPLETVKHTYAQAFTVYALSAYALASGEPEPLRRALELYTLIETRMTDPAGYQEALDRSFRPLANDWAVADAALLKRRLTAKKTMNTLLHVLEAYTLLYEASGDEQVKRSLQALLACFENRVYNRAQNRLEVYFDAQLHSVLDMQSFGHDIEASWLLDVAAGAALGGAERAGMERLTTALAQGVFTRAFRDGSLLNECVEGVVDPTRIWWAQAESMVGLANLWQKTGEPALMSAMESEWHFITSAMADPLEGPERFWALDSSDSIEHRAMVEPWKCPYHNGRMCLELMARL